MGNSGSRIPPTTLQAIIFVWLACLGMSGKAVYPSSTMTVAEALDTNDELSVFTRALHHSTHWDRIVDAQYVTLFVVPDTELQAEGTEILLQKVLLAAENTVRLHNTLAQHIYYDQVLDFGGSDTIQLSNVEGGCTAAVHTGRNAVQVGPEARVLSRSTFSNGEIISIDRLLWEPWDRDRC